jgi:hypothetical protein
LRRRSCKLAALYWLASPAERPEKDRQAAPRRETRARVLAGALVDQKF